MTTERNRGPAGERQLPATSEPGSGPTGPGASAARGAGLRALVAAVYVAGLGLAVASWAKPSVEVGGPEGALVDAEEGQACADGLPPGHPPVERMTGLPPGHPPVPAMPNLPAGHPPIPSAPPPAIAVPPLQVFTI